MAHRFFALSSAGIASLFATGCLKPISCEETLTCPRATHANEDGGVGSAEAGLDAAPTISAATEGGVDAAPQVSTAASTGIDTAASAVMAPDVGVEDASAQNGEALTDAATAASAGGRDVGTETGNGGDGNSCVGGEEACDGVDNNCDGEVDEGFNLTSDADNCGACGHSCLGGSCEFSACQLFVLAEYPEPQSSVRRFGDYVYSSASGNFNVFINRVSLDGRERDLNVALAHGGVVSFVDDTRFFYVWRNYSDFVYLSSCQADQSSCADPDENVQLPLVQEQTGAGTPILHDVEGHRIFWSSQKGGGLFASATGTFDPVSLRGTFESDFIFAGESLWGRQGESVLRVSTTGGLPLTIAEAPDAHGFAANSTQLFWVAGEKVYSISLPFGPGEGQPGVPFEGPEGARALTVDDQRLLWLESTSGGVVIKSCPVNGCEGPPAILSTPLAIASGIVVDDQAVYIAVGAVSVGGRNIAGGILSLAK